MNDKEKEVKVVKVYEKAAELLETIIDNGDRIYADPCEFLDLTENLTARKLLPALLEIVEANIARENDGYTYGFGRVAYLHQGNPDLLPVLSEKTLIRAKNKDVIDTILLFNGYLEAKERYE